MKKIIVLLILWSIVIIVHSQNKKHVILEEIEVTPPRFTNCNSAARISNEHQTQSIGEFIQKDFKYPNSSTSFINEGTEVVKFIVTASGDLKDYKIINSLALEVDNEIIRVLKTTNGMWIPGAINENPVNMEREIRIIINTDVTEKSALRRNFAVIAQSSYIKGGNKFIVSGKPKRALKHFDNGIKYLPNNKSLLLMRGLCRYELDDKVGARADWLRLKELGGNDLIVHYFNNELDKLKGYEEATLILKEEGKL